MKPIDVFISFDELSWPSGKRRSLCNRKIQGTIQRRYYWSVIVSLPTAGNRTESLQKLIIIDKVLPIFSQCRLTIPLFSPFREGHYETLVQ